MSDLTSIFINTLDKHAPMKPMSRREIKLNAKPWITKEILISIKTRNRLFTVSSATNAKIQLKLSITKNTVTNKLILKLFLNSSIMKAYFERIVIILKNLGRLLEKS